MHLYLIRHAEARPVGDPVATDVERPLSETGENDALRLGRLLAAADPGLSLVLTSPLQRAVETGARIASALRPAPLQRTTPNLAPGFDAEELTQELLALGSDIHIALVGHQPDMGTLLARLITGRDRGSVAFTPGTAALVIATPLGTGIDGQLRWLITPRLAELLPGRTDERRML